MARSRTARPRASGFRIQRSALGLAFATLLCTGLNAAPPRIPYLSIPEAPVVTWRGHRIGPRIGYPALPADMRVAPIDFVLDGDETDIPSAEEMEAAQSRIAIAQFSQNYRPHPAIWKISSRNDS